MIYRRILDSDKEKILEMCENKNIKYDGRKPLVGFVAVGDNGELVGFILAHSAVLLEPFICDNPTAAVKLYYKMDGALDVLNVQTVLAHIKDENDKLKSELPRLGFTEIDSSYTMFKRI